MLSPKSLAGSKYALAYTEGARLAPRSSPAIPRSGGGALRTALLFLVRLVRSEAGALMVMLAVARR